LRGLGDQRAPDPNSRSWHGLQATSSAKGEDLTSTAEQAWDGGIQAAKLAMAIAVSTATALPVLLASALAVQIRHSFHFGPSGLGEAVAAYYLAAAGSAVPLGRLAELAGSVTVMRAASLGSALSVLGVVTLVRSWGGLLIALVLAGLAAGGAQPATNLFLARSVPNERQGAAFGIKQASVPLATFLGGLAVPAVALTVGWQWAFVGAACLACAAATLVRRNPDEQSAALGTYGGRPQSGRSPLLMLACGFGLALMATSSLASFLVLSSVNTGLNPAAAGWVAASAALAGLVVRVAAGFQADRRGRRHLPVVAAMMLIGAAGFVALAIGSAVSAEPLFIAGAIVAFGVGWGWNGLFNFAVVRSYPDAPARATGFTQAAGRVGSVVGPLMFGFVVEKASFWAAWLLGAASLVAAAGVVATGRRLLVRRRLPPLAS
jgi:MFS family permease